MAALLRAVNVGGRKLAMADLKAALEAAGFEAPETLLASGNAVFGAEGDSAEVERRVQAALAPLVPTEVLVRDRAGLQRVVDGNPFAAMARDDPGRLVVFFVRGEPGELAALEPYCTQGEEAAPGPGCLYIAYPGGQGTSKLTITVLERRLGVTGTGRNWNTVGKLLARL